MTAITNPLSSRGFGLLAAVLAVVLLAYYPSLNNGFVNWDDDSHLLENPSVLDLNATGIKDIFSTWVNDTYIPLTVLSFAVERHFFGFDPAIYHLDNLLLHLAVTMLVFFLGQRLGLTATAAAGGALLFGVHPLHVESVAWVTERKDVLCAVFYLWAVYVYSGYARNGKEGLLRWAFLLGVVSVLAKPMALSLPLIFLVCDWFCGRRIDRKVLLEKVPLAALFAPLVWMTYSLQLRLPGHDPLAGLLGAGAGQELSEKLLLWVWCFSFYLQKFLFPNVLVLFYNSPKPIDFFNPHYWGSLLAAGVVFILLVFNRKDRWLCFAFVFYFVSIFFLLRYDDPDVNVVADRFMYLPSVGFCLYFGYIWQGTFQRFNRNRAAAVSMLAAVILLGSISGTFRQCGVWKSGITLFEHQRRYGQDAAVAVVNAKLAEAYSQEPGFKEDLSEHRRSRTDGLMPLALLSQDRVKKVVGLYEEALRVNPGQGWVYYKLGRIYEDAGEDPAAAGFFAEAVRRNPQMIKAYLDLAAAYKRMGQVEKAAEAYGRMVRIDPETKIIYREIIGESGFGN